jgi:hypothetical protein
MGKKTEGVDDFKKYINSPKTKKPKDKDWEVSSTKETPLGNKLKAGVKVSKDF